MPHLDGAHTHSNHGGGLGGPAAAGIGLFLAAAILPALLALLHALLIALAAVTAVALAAAAGALIWRLRRPPPVPPWQPGAVRAAQRPAVAPQQVHLHLHGASPADIAAALAQLPAATTPAAWPAPSYQPARKDQP